MKETKLINAIRALPRHIEPQRDLWPGIDTRLENVVRGNKARSTAPLWRSPAMAAAVVLALVTGILLGRGMTVSPVEHLPPFTLGIALAGIIETTEREYQAAFRELASLDYSGVRLAGDDSDSLRGSWEDLQQAEASLLAAVRQYPSNIFLNQKLLNLRSQQLQFIKQMALLEQNNWRRT